MRVTTSPWPAVLLAALIAVAGCSREKPESERRAKAAEAAETLGTQAQPGGDSAGVQQASTTAPLPRMIDLGRGKCIPCKKMEPILKELKQAYAGRSVIEIINLDDQPGAADKYGIRLIPTQIFFDAAGAEVWRHEGFLPRDAIVGKFAEMGVEPPEGAQP